MTSGAFSRSLNLLQGFEAVHAGQPDVEQHDVEGAFAQSFQAGFAAVRNRGLVAFVLEHALERLPDAGFVVHDEDVMHAGEWRGTGMTSAATGNSTTKRVPTGWFSSTRMEP